MLPAVPGGVTEQKARRFQGGVQLQGCPEALEPLLGLAQAVELQAAQPVQSPGCLGVAPRGQARLGEGSGCLGVPAHGLQQPGRFQQQRPARALVRPLDGALEAGQGQVRRVQPLKVNSGGLLQERGGGVPLAASGQRLHSRGHLGPRPCFSLEPQGRKPGPFVIRIRLGRGAIEGQRLLRIVQVLLPNPRGPKEQLRPLDLVAAGVGLLPQQLLQLLGAAGLNEPLRQGLQGHRLARVQLQGQEQLLVGLLSVAHLGQPDQGALHQDGGPGLGVSGGPLLRFQGGDEQRRLTSVDMQPGHSPGGRGELRALLKDLQRARPVLGPGRQQPPQLIADQRRPPG